KHTPAGTHITLRAYRAGAATSAAERVIVEVVDDGQGIPPERLDRVFEKFTRFGGGQRTHQDSTGLGLSFCRLAVEAQDGSINVASCVGQGATFRLELPGL